MLTNQDLIKGFYTWEPLEGYRKGLHQCRLCEKIRFTQLGDVKRECSCVKPFEISEGEKKEYEFWLSKLGLKFGDYIIVKVDLGRITLKCPQGTKRRLNYYLTKQQKKVSCSCRRCRPTNVVDTPTKVYYVRLKYKDTYVYKIGITKHGGLERFAGEIAKSKVTLIKDWSYSTRKEAWAAERKILDIHSNHLLTADERVLKNSGNTEIFYTDVLGLDQDFNSKE